MNSQLNKRLRLLTIFNLFIIAALLSSCSLVRSNDTNNFTRVKYNPHWKVSKSANKAEVKKYKAEKLKIHQMEKKIAAVSEEAPKQPIYQSVTKVEEGALTAAVDQTERKKTDARQLFSPLINQLGESSFVTDWSELLKTNTTVVSPEISDDDLGTLIWIILAVLLVLLLLSILAELGGGLIGTLLAVLLILLILRLLGII